jgi:hypothetical protein
MTRLGGLRIAAAAAAIVTALLLQGSLLAPLVAPVPVSVPAVLVAAVALIDGPGVGMALGFTAGLIADLSSRHAAGVLCLAWMAVGLSCGLFEVPQVKRGLAGLPPAPMRHLVARGIAAAAVACTLATLAAQLFLAAVGQDGATLADSFAHLIPTFAGDAVLALLLVPLARFMLTHGQLRSTSTQDAASAAQPTGVGLVSAGRSWYG